jgi:hypothetical protein
VYFITPADLAKDGALTAVGFVLPFSISSAEAALFVGLINAAIVAVYRFLELRRRDRREGEIVRLRARVDELEAARPATNQRPPRSS